MIARLCRVLRAAMLVAVVASACHPGPPAPPFQLIARQGSMVAIVVDESVAEDDAALFQIADALLPRMRGRMIQVHVWTDRRQAPTGKIFDMTEAQFAARRVMVTINPSTGARTVEARHQP